MGLSQQGRHIATHSASRPRKRHFLQLPLQIGIISAFVILAVPSIIGIIWFVYRQNSIAMRKVADDAMALASAAMISEGVDMVDAAGDTVDLLAGIGNADPKTLREPRILNVLLDAVRNTPQTYAFYVGFGSDGAFNQAVRLPKGLLTFGQNNTPIPQNAQYVIRRLVRPAHRPTLESYSYLSEDGKIVLRETIRAPRYDPRKRPFFLGALADSTQRATSELYTFTSSGKVGVTVSRGFGYANGRIAGAAGVDIALDSMSEFLSRYTPGRNGIAIIVDDKGQLVAHPDARKVVYQKGNEIAVTQAGALDDPRIRGALAAYAGRKGGERTTFRGADGQEYIASLRSFPPDLGTRWQLLIVVPLDDFVDVLKQATHQVLLVGLGVLLIVIIGIGMLSRALTSSIARLIDETRRIREFELEADFTLRSRITEIIHLGEAITTLKTTLRSVAKFMPRTLVRDLLTTGTGLALGGENRVITVMFTDLTDFSTLAERVSPQELALRTSDYLDVVSQEVIQQHGTIDKYIGDSVMALWNAPILDQIHIEHACRAALHAVRAFRASNDQWTLKGWDPLAIRIGLHADSVVVGVIGSNEHMSYTALGDGVNIAARLEGMNKVYGTSICVSRTIQAAAAALFLMRPLDYVAVKGRSESILIYELMGTLAEDAEIGATAEQREQAMMTEAAFTAWINKDIRKSAALYQRLLDRFPLDGVARLCVNRCRQDYSQTSSSRAAV